MDRHHLRSALCVVQASLAVAVLLNSSIAKTAQQANTRTAVNRPLARIVQTPSIPAHQGQYSVQAASLGNTSCPQAKPVAVIVILGSTVAQEKRSALIVHQANFRVQAWPLLAQHVQQASLQAVPNQSAATTALQASTVDRHLRSALSVPAVASPAEMATEGVQLAMQDRQARVGRQLAPTARVASLPVPPEHHSAGTARAANLPPIPGRHLAGRVPGGSSLSSRPRA